MEYNYITVPKSVTSNKIEENNYCFASSKYSRFYPNENVEYRTLSSLIKESTKKKKIRKHKVYRYTEIGDINIYSGLVEGNYNAGYYVPSGNPKEIKENDILISTVRTYRGGVGLVTNAEDNLVCSPAIMVLRENDNIVTKEYLFAVLKTKFFIEQVLGFQNRGMYPRLDKESIDYIYIPIPKDPKVMEYITALTKAYLNKQKLILKRHKDILEKIDYELINNHKQKGFKFQYPNYKELCDNGRLDTNLYRKSFKEINYMVKNYIYGSSNIYDLGFELSRGQNLQVSNIGKSIYSDKYHKGFYTLILPKHISVYGVEETVEYLGNPKSLKTLKQGDLIFGAEGFEKGRSIVVIEESAKTITNIHGITIKQKNKNLSLSIFVKCMLDYFRSKGLIDLFAVGGNGGSLAQKYWESIQFPNFPQEKYKSIVELYHNPKAKYQVSKSTLDNFLTADSEFNEIAGIYELDKSSKLLRVIINRVIDNIINDKPVNVSFNFNAQE